ncbi:MAG: protein kinase [Gemmataceae bacterium]
MESALVPGLAHLFSCLGRSVLKHGGKALSSLVPFGEVLYEVARDACEEYRRESGEAMLRADLEEAARASVEDARRAAEEVLLHSSEEQSDRVRQALVGWLTQIPASVRQSLRPAVRPGWHHTAKGVAPGAGGSGRLPPPAGPPRFRAGDRPLAADWELVELLGKGGFGEVWRARHIHQTRKKPVALKFCLDPVAATTLRNEAALHDLLDRVREEAAGPGIVALLETFLGNDPPCLMYEYIDGGDLAGLARDLHAQRRMNADRATELTRRLATIVALAHRLTPPLVHRDLKLSNVLVRRAANEQHDLVVADLGIGGLAATQALRDQSARPTLGGILPTALRGAHTPLYASPQQARGAPPDPRDDVHALGVIWYQLLTGDLHLLSIPPDWRDVAEERGLTSRLLDVLAGCLSSRAEKRPGDASALAQLLAGGSPPVPSAISVVPVAVPPPRPPDDPAPRMATNLQRLRETERLEVWVRQRLQGWNHHDWLALLEELERAGFAPLDHAQLGAALEQIRLEQRQREAEREAEARRRKSEQAVREAKNRPSVAPPPPPPAPPASKSPVDKPVEITHERVIDFPLPGAWESAGATVGGWGQMTPLANTPGKLTIRPYSRYLVKVGSNVTDADLACLRELWGTTALVWVMLNECKLITDLGLSHLRGLTRLECLRISLAPNVTDAGLEHLAPLTALRMLDLDGCPAVSDAGLTHLAGLRQLTSLTLKGCRVTDKGLAHLSGLAQLSKLEVKDCPVQGTGLQHLTELSSLQDLTLQACPLTEGGLAPLRRLRRLRRLYFYECSTLTETAMGHVGAVSTVEWLKFWCCPQVTDAHLAALVREGALQALTNLDLTGCEQVTDAGMAHLRQLPALKSLTLHGSGVKRGPTYWMGVSQLARLQRSRGCEVYI